MRNIELEKLSFLNSLEHKNVTFKSLTESCFWSLLLPDEHGNYGLQISECVTIISRLDSSIHNDDLLLEIVQAISVVYTEIWSGDSLRVKNIISSSHSYDFEYRLNSIRNTYNHQDKFISLTLGRLLLSTLTSRKALGFFEKYHHEANEAVLEEKLLLANKNLISVLLKCETVFNSNMV